MSRQRLNTRSLVLVICAVCCFMLFPVKSLAAEVSETITIEQVFNDQEDAASQKTFGYQLTALNNAPLPNSAEGNEYTFSISGNNSVSLAVSFDRQGTYSYQLTQIVKNKLAGYQYDERVIDVDIYVYPVNQDNDLEVAMTAKNENGYKLDQIRFTNTFITETKEATVASAEKKAASSLPKTNDQNNPFIKMIGLAVIFISLLLMLLKNKLQHTRKES